jgi:protein phosphatase
VRDAIDRIDLWDELDTTWLALDCELMPWSVKAQELLRQQYAAVGAAATNDLAAELAMYEQVASRLPEAAALATRTRDRAHAASQFVDAYRRYCWPVTSVDDLALAPFQILATEGHVRALEPHPWHLEVLARLVDADAGVMRATRSLEVDLDDTEQVAAAIAWWEQLTQAGGEGMVVKPRDVIATTKRGISQPGIKCRGPEYLRIIYGPEYTTPEHLDRLRQRGLGHKRSLAVREYALGIEALERFVAREPLYRVHECVFGVLALESEPVDPRL